MMARFATEILLVFLCAVEILAHDCDTVQQGKVQLKAKQGPDSDYESATVTVDELKNYKNHHEVVFYDAVIPVLCQNFLKELTNVHVLEFRNVGLEEIKPGAFKDLIKLDSLIISNNPLSKIPSGVFNGLKTTKITLTENKISEIASDSFDDLPNLKELYLSKNQIRVIHPDWFKNTPALHAVDLNYNSIEEIPAFTLKNIQKSNHNVFLLQSNNIKTVHTKAFVGFDNVEIIDLSSNENIQIEDDAFVDTKGTRVLINSARWSCISDGLLESLKLFTFVHLQGNPLSCDCQKKIIKYQKDNNLQIAYTWQMVQAC